MTKSSRIPGFYRLTLHERRVQLAEHGGFELDELVTAFDNGGLSAETADKVVENVLGVYGLPFGVALNFRVNGVDRLVPMVVEEPSVVAAASNAAKMVRGAGGFQAEADAPVMISQVQLVRPRDPAAAEDAPSGAAAASRPEWPLRPPGLVARGGGARGLEVRRFDETG